MLFLTYRYAFDAFLRCSHLDGGVKIRFLMPRFLKIENSFRTLLDFE